MKELISKLLQNPVFLEYQMFILPALAVVICLLLIALLVIPQSVNLIRSQGDIAAVSEQAKQLEAKIALLGSIDSDQVKSDIETSLIALPEEKDIPAMIGQLLYLVSINRIKLEGISFASTTSQTEGIDSLQVQLDLSGEMADLKEFMAAVKNSARIIKIVTIQITGGGQDQIQAQLTLVTYFRKLPTSIGNLEDPVATLTQAESDILNEIKNRSLTSPVASSQDLTGPRGKPDPFE